MRDEESAFSQVLSGTAPGDYMSLLAAWQNFYVIVGSSAGALIGLQFVVITLIADSRDSCIDHCSRHTWRNSDFCHGVSSVV